MKRFGQNDWDGDNENNNNQNWEYDPQRSQSAARLSAFGAMERGLGDGGEKYADEFSAADNAADSANRIDETDENYTESCRRFMARVYNWMVGGLALTAALAWFVSNSMEIMQRLMPLMTILVLVELGVVLLMSFCIRKMSASVMGVCYIIYAALTGITLAPLCLAYKVSSLASTFAVCSGMFAALSIYGHVTRRSLSALGSFCFMGLIGVLVGGIINLFMGSPMLDFVVTCSGIVVFAGLTAYDTRKLTKIHQDLYADGQRGEKIQKMAIMGALTLYLDFINLFIKLLRLFGKRR